MVIWPQDPISYDQMLFYFTAKEAAQGQMQIKNKNESADRCLQNYSYNNSVYMFEHSVKATASIVSVDFQINVTDTAINRS